jgi:hypothetical protein
MNSFIVLGFTFMTWVHLEFIFSGGGIRV